MEDRRDIHNSERQIENYIETINRSSMSEAQKKRIKTFVEDISIGKYGSKVKSRRIASYLQFFGFLHKYFKKDFDKISEEEAKDFYIDLQKNKILRKNRTPYSQVTKDLFVRTLKKYLGWFHGGKESKRYRTIVGWMKEDYKKSDKKAITLENARNVTSKEPSIRNKALFMFLFDSGSRIEEALNVRIKDVSINPRKNNSGEYYTVYLRGTKTEDAERTISLPLCYKEVTDWLKEHPTKKPDDFLFPINYDNTRKILRTMTKRVLGFTLSPHELRHSSATHYINVFGNKNIGQFYYRFGWKFGSSEAVGYIKTNLFGSGEGQEETIKVVESGEIERLKDQLTAMQQKMILINNMLEILRPSLFSIATKDKDVSIDDQEILKYLDKKRNLLGAQ